MVRCCRRGKPGCLHLQLPLARFRQAAQSFAFSYGCSSYQAGTLGMLLCSAKVALSVFVGPTVTVVAFVVLSLVLRRFGSIKLAGIGRRGCCRAARMGLHQHGKEAGTTMRIAASLLFGVVGFGIAGQLFAVGQTAQTAPSVPQDCKYISNAIAFARQGVQESEQCLATSQSELERRGCQVTQKTDQDALRNLEPGLAKCLTDHQAKIPSALVPEAGCAQKSSTEQELQNVQAQIRRDQAAIQRLGFSQSVQDIQDWQKLSTSAKADFTSQVFDMLLATTRASYQWGGSLSPPLASRDIGFLRSKGIDSEALNAAIRKIAGTPGKPARAADVISFIDEMGRWKDTVMTAKGFAENGVKRDTALDALSTVLGWFETDPRLAYLATDLKFTTASIYYIWARRSSVNQINRLTALSEANLRSLKALTSRLQDDVGKLNSIKQVLEALSACP